MATVKMLALAQFIASKTGATALTVTCDVDEFNIDGSAVNASFLTAQSMTHVRNGIYRLFFDGDDTKLYTATAKTSDSSVDQQHIAAVIVRLDKVNTIPTAASNATAVRSELATELGRIDTSTSSRLAAASYSAAPSAATVADAVADEVMADHTVPGSLAVLVSAAGSAADPLMNIVPGNYPNGSGGDALGRIASGQLTIVQSVLADGYVRIVPGDDYIAAIGTAIDITGDGWPDISEAAVTWIFGETELTGSAVDADTVRLELTSAQSTALGEDEAGQGYYDVVASIPTGTPGESYRVTLVRSARRLVG